MAAMEPGVDSELLRFLLPVGRPSVAGIVFLGVLLVQPVRFVFESFRAKSVWVRAAAGFLIAGAAAGIIRIPGAFVISLAPLMVFNIYLFLRYRKLRNARKALEHEIETGFLDTVARKQVEEMIVEVEKASGAEIRILVELDHPGDPQERAKGFFHELGMDRTAEGTGILFYFCLRQKQFAIFGSVTQEIASRAVALGEAAFRQAKFGDGIVAMLGELLDHLAGHFPRRPDDRNELPDHVIVII